MKIFKEVLQDVNLTYQKNKKGKQDSWKNMSIEYLNNKFDEELEEFNQAETKEESYRELLDIILVGLMLAERVRTSKNKLTKSEKKLVTNVSKASAIVLKEDKKLFKKLAKV